jgi:hypothetical protein
MHDEKPAIFTEVAATSSIETNYAQPQVPRGDSGFQSVLENLTM